MEVSDGLWVCSPRGGGTWGPQHSTADSWLLVWGGGGCLTEADPKIDPISAPATPGKYRKQLYSKGQVI